MKSSCQFHGTDITFVPCKLCEMICKMNYSENSLCTCCTYPCTCGKSGKYIKQDGLVDKYKQGIKHDQNKLRYDLINPVAQEEFVKVLTYGANKYAARNWEKGIDRDRLLAAAYRHISSYQKGEIKDPESSLLHIAHAICCLHFLLALETDKNLEANKSKNYYSTVLGFQSYEDKPGYTQSPTFNNPFPIGLDDIKNNVKEILKDRTEDSKDIPSPETTLRSDNLGRENLSDWNEQNSPRGDERNSCPVKYCTESKSHFHNTYIDTSRDKWRVTFSKAVLKLSKESQKIWDK